MSEFLIPWFMLSSSVFCLGNSIYPFHENFLLLMLTRLINSMLAGASLKLTIDVIAEAINATT